MRHLAICAVRQYLVFPSGVVTIFNETIVTESERLLKKVAPAHCSDHFRKTLPVLGWERDLIFSAPDLTLFYIKKPRISQKLPGANIFYDVWQVKSRL